MTDLQRTVNQMSDSDIRRMLEMIFEDEEDLLSPRRRVVERRGLFSTRVFGIRIAVALALAPGALYALAIWWGVLSQAA